MNKSHKVSQKIKNLEVLTLLVILYSCSTFAHSLNTGGDQLYKQNKASVVQDSVVLHGLSEPVELYMEEENGGLLIPVTLYGTDATREVTLLFDTGTFASTVLLPEAEFRPIDWDAYRSVSFDVIANLGVDALIKLIVTIDGPNQRIYFDPVESEGY